MKINEFITEDDDGNPYKSSSRIKHQVIPTSHAPSKLQTFCRDKNLVKGDMVFVKVGEGKDDYEYGVFLRAGEKMLHIHNYDTNQQEAVDPKTVYTKDGFKYVPLVGKKKNN